MALIVQPSNSEVVIGANSYISLANATTYLKNRGVNNTITEGQLLRGADYINSFRERFKGCKLTSAGSSMQWPRSDVYLDHDLLDSKTIPDLIPSAQVEVALEISNNRDPLETVDKRVIKKKRTDVIETEYDTSRQVLRTFDYRRIMALLRPVLNNNLGLVTR